MMPVSSPVTDADPTSFDQVFWSAPVALAVLRVPAQTQQSALIVSGNRQLCELLGAAAEELTSVPIDRLIHDHAGGSRATTLLLAGCGRLGWTASVRRFRGGAGVRAHINATELGSSGPREFVVSILPLEPDWRPGGPPARVTYFQDIVEYSPALIYIKDVHGRFEYINKHYAEHFGLQPEQVLGHTNSHIFPPDMAVAFDANDDLIRSTGQAHEFEEPAAGPHGAYRSVKFPLFDGAGQVIAVGGISTEITDLKLAQAAESLARDRAERASRAKTELLSRMSHELRTPLNSIIGFGQLLERQVDSEQLRQPVSRILTASNLLLDLINELLDLAKIEAGHVELRMEPVHAVEPVLTVIELLRPLAGRRDIELSVDLHRGLHEFVAADRQRLGQVLLNIIGNGVKYSGPRGKVSVRFDKPAAGRLRFLISDTGPGLQPEDLDQLFLPFTRLPAGEPDIEGTGLGLALSKSLVESMGGEIGVWSGVGAGSTFFLDLPITVAPADAWEAILNGGQHTTAAEPIALPDLPPSTVLYVEDDPTNIELTQQIFALCPRVSVVIATTAADGIAAARTVLPDLVLIDLHLPDMPGEEVFRRLRANPATATIPIAVFSADATAQQIDRLRGSGVDDYITKPVDLRDFLTRVRALLPSSSGAPQAGRS